MNGNASDQCTAFDAKITEPIPEVKVVEQEQSRFLSCTRWNVEQSDFQSEMISLRGNGSVLDPRYMIKLKIYFNFLRIKIKKFKNDLFFEPSLLGYFQAQGSWGGKQIKKWMDVLVLMANVAKIGHNW